MGQGGEPSSSGRIPLLVPVGVAGAGAGAVLVACAVTRIGRPVCATSQGRLTFLSKLLVHRKSAGDAGDQSEVHIIGRRTRDVN